MGGLAGKGKGYFQIMAQIHVLHKVDTLPNDIARERLEDQV